MEILVEQLKGSNRLIIIDEADHLSLDALQAVRNLNDLVGVGIVLSGLEALDSWERQKGGDCHVVAVPKFIKANHKL